MKSLEIKKLCKSYQKFSLKNVDFSVKSGEIRGFIGRNAVAALRMTVLKDVEVYVHNVMLSANLTFLAFVLVIYMLFNIIFVGGFFKTAYYYGKVFVIFAVVSVFVVGISETLHHIPGLEFLNAVSGGGVVIQIGILIAGIVLYAVGTILSMNVSIKRFEKLDL